MECIYKHTSQLHRMWTHFTDCLEASTLSGIVVVVVEPCMRRESCVSDHINWLLTVLVIMSQSCIPPTDVGKHYPSSQTHGRPHGRPNGCYISSTMYSCFMTKVNKKLQRNTDTFSYSIGEVHTQLQFKILTSGIVQTVAIFSLSFEQNPFQTHFVTAPCRSFLVQKHTGSDVGAIKYFTVGTSSA